MAKSTACPHGLAVCRFLILIAALLLAPPSLAGPARTDEPIRPIPPADDLDKDRVELGEQLFHDTRLSTDDTISCASCHPLALGGADRSRVSTGVDGAVGKVNTPTVYNSRFNLAQFWDGRARTLEAQVAGPLHTSFEMASNWSEVTGKLREDRKLVRQFQKAYKEGLTPETVADALATFERSLVTPDSPFDRWLAGDDKALSKKALAGYRLFKSYGCTACHQGKNVGGNMFQKLGTMGDYFADRGEVKKADYGRFNVTGDEQDRYVFKVPSLRLATRTPPYFHDGSQKTLQQAITTMASYQLGRTIAKKDVERIIRFLESLVGHNPHLAPAP